MQLDLNDKANLTLANVASLLASKDDSQDRQLRVTTNGILFLSDDVGADNLDDILFRLNSFDASHDYTGIEASKHTSLIKNIYQHINANWPVPKSTYIDIF